MLEEVIDRGDWPHALELALEAWRGSRLPELAELIDVLGARCSLPTLPRAKSSKAYQTRWLELARAYDPVAVTTLARDPWARASTNDQRFAEIRTAWGDDHPLVAAIIEVAPEWFDKSYAVDHMNVIGRLVAIWHWPDDPRMAQILARLIETMPLQFHRREVVERIYERAADRIVALGDLRVAPVLERCIEESRAQTGPDLVVQRRLATQVLDRLAHPPRDPARIEAANRLRALLRVAAPPSDLAALWREVAASPDDDAPRLVLADALTEAGDSRGEMIALQLAGGTHNLNLATRIILRDSATWLGDLRLALTRKGTVFRRGMLEIIRAGQIATPDWVWPKLAGHRELATVHTAAPAHVTPADYAQLLRALPNLRTLTVDAPSVFDTMAPCPTVTHLHYRQDNLTIQRPLRTALVPTFTAAARVLPNLELLQITALQATDLPEQLGAVIGLAPELFPRLRTLRIPEILLRQNGGVSAIARESPIVELT